MLVQDWLSATATILLESDRGRALKVLAAALRSMTHARTAVRLAVVTSGPVPGVNLEVFGPRDRVEPWLVGSLQEGYPFTRFFAATYDPRPRSLDQVRSAGFDFTPTEQARFCEAGVSPHQVALPLGGAAERYTGWTFFSDTPYDEAEVARLTTIQPLVTGLDAHVVGCDQLERAGAGPSPRPCGDLTPGEQRVLALMYAGLTAAAIARHLRVSPRTVHKHQEHLYRKLGATDRLSAILAAQVAGMLPDPRMVERSPQTAPPGRGHSSGSSHSGAQTAMPSIT